MKKETLTLKTIPKGYEVTRRRGLKDEKTWMIHRLDEHGKQELAQMVLDITQAEYKLGALK